MHPKNLTWIKNFLTWDFHLNSIDNPSFHGFEGQEPGIIRFYLPIDIHNTVHSSPCPQFSFKFIPIKIPSFCSLVRSFHKSTSIQHMFPIFCFFGPSFPTPRGSHSTVQRPWRHEATRCIARTRRGSCCRWMPSSVFAWRAMPGIEWIEGIAIPSTTQGHWGVGEWIS
jgi:hypothetical protein